MALVATETWTGTNGASWPAQWTTSLAAGTGGSATIQSNQGKLTCGSAAFQAERASLSGMTATTDMEVLVTIIPQNPIVTQYAVVAVRSATAFQAGGSFPTDGYVVELDFANNLLKLNKVVSSTATQLGSSASKTFTAGTNVKVRFRIQGTAIKCKVWNVGSSEPTTGGADGAGNDFSTTDSSITAAGRVSLTAQNGAASYAISFDDLTVDDLAGNTASATGSVSLAGSSTATLGFSRTASGSVSLAGTSTATLRYSTSATGSITLSGTATSSGGTAASAAGSLTLSGSATANLTFAASATGSITLTGTALNEVFSYASGEITISGIAYGRASYLFTPPTIKLRPADPQGERLWLYYGLDVGISVLKNHDGTYTTTQFPTTDQMNEAAFTYLGGHIYEVDNDEYAALVAAGYIVDDTPPPDDGGDGGDGDPTPPDGGTDPPGFGDGGFGEGGFGT